MVEDALEIVEEDGVGGTFEDKRQLHIRSVMAELRMAWAIAYPPIRIDAAVLGHTRNGHDDVHDKEDERQEHAEYHDGESGACAD